MKKDRVKIRKKWHINPVTKVEPGLKDEYNRTEQKREFKKELDELLDLPEEEDSDDNLSTAG